jgi:hypothetical protein
MGSGCAQIGMPLGGPKDTIPPVLLNSNPPNNTIHYKGNRIVLTFDEYVQLNNLQENLLVAPTPKSTPNVDYKLKTVTIKLRDTLLANTTYSILSRISMKIILIPIIPMFFQPALILILCNSVAM